MVQTLEYGQSFDFNNNFVDDVYLEVIPPQSFFNGVPTSIAAAVGTASWGRLNYPQLISSPQGMQGAYGAVQPAAVTDIHDLCFDIKQALNQVASQGLSIYGIRVSDGTDVAALLTLLDDQSPEMTAAIGGSTFNNGDVVELILTNADFPNGQVTVSYTVQTSDTANLVAAGLATAVGVQATLVADSVTAVASGANVNFSWPNTLGGITFSKLVTGTGNETVTFTNHAANGIVLTAKCSGTLGNQITVHLQNSNIANAVDVIVVPFPGGGQSETFRGISTAGSGTGNFWNLLAKAINMGQGPTRPPSNWLVASGASNSALVPLLGTFVLASGTDGRGVSTANLLGSPTGGVGGTGSGIYTLENVQFAPSVSWICGLTDATAYPSIVDFAFQNNLFFLLTFAAGVTTAGAVAAKLTYGITDYHLAFVKDWVYIFDQDNNVVRLVPPLATAGGAIAALAPWNSPFNKGVQSILGTERNNPYTGTILYSNAEIAQLAQAGITFIANPIPAGPQFGFRNGYNSIGAKKANAVIEYSRLTNFIVQTVGANLGQYEGQLEGTSPTDPLRAKISANLNQFFGAMKNAGQIADFNVICNNTNNSTQSVAQHGLVIDMLVQYMSSVLDILARLQGGVTVQVNTNQTGATSQ